MDTNDGMVSQMTPNSNCKIISVNLYPVTSLFLLLLYKQQNRIFTEVSGNQIIHFNDDTIMFQLHSTLNLHYYSTTTTA